MDVEIAFRVSVFVKLINISHCRIVLFRYFRQHMRKYFVAFTTLLFAGVTLYAQQATQVAGVYSLSGVMETASGFALNKDSSFEFYYSYGALDRYGAGKWRFIDNNVVLNSNLIHDKDFTAADSSLTKDNFTTIKIDDKNPAFYRFVYCLLKTPHGDTLINADDSGIIILPVITDTVTLLFELSPERVSKFTVNSKKFNSYTFHFEPWAVEVFFTDFTLRFVNGHLEGKHPLLDNKTYTYMKEN